MTPRHILSIKDINKYEFYQIWAGAYRARDEATILVKPMMADDLDSMATVGLIFLENSTRTRHSFEIAIRRLGMTPITILKDEYKGDSLADTVKVLEGLGAEAIVIRTSDVLDDALAVATVPIINAGDGANNHPTQALGDFCFLKSHFGSVVNRKLLIIGDVAHCRVAHSVIELASMLGMQVIACSPTMHPYILHDLPVESYRWVYTPELALTLFDGEVDAVMTFRPQQERIAELDKYLKELQPYRLTSRLMGCMSNTIILHPGPRTAVEMEPELAQDKRFKMQDQVRWGLYARTALLWELMTGRLK